MKLIFVYNANSGRVNAVIDSIHKITSPETYSCNLCAITFGNFSENKTWKHFRESSSVEMAFYHRDEFLKEYRSKWLPKYELPVILLVTNGELELAVSSEDINKLEGAEALVEMIKNHLLHY